MLKRCGADSLDDLIALTLPAALRGASPMELPQALSERDALVKLAEFAEKNQVFRSYLGQGYHDCLTPSVLLRNILEDPGWYTQYTPYQAEISQGRLEALLNFQTMILDLSGMEVANSSLLDEGTAAAEAMTLSLRVLKSSDTRNEFFVSEHCHPQNICVVRTRAEPLGIRVVVGDHQSHVFSERSIGALLQYPMTDGRIVDYGPCCARAHDVGAIVTVACDLLALTILRAPSEFGADVVIGNSQRFGVPLGYGGPHAAFMATREAYKRQLPGRIIGLSKDSHGQPALRLALQTREQHIRREKATSNICTAQVLLAIVASFYAVYHGKDGLVRIAKTLRTQTGALAQGLQSLGWKLETETHFDTLRVTGGPLSSDAVIAAARKVRINLRDPKDGSIIVALDETVSGTDLQDLFRVFGGVGQMDLATLQGSVLELPELHRRKTPFLQHPVFHSYQSETELLRYLHDLREKDLSLTTSMIPLGSCTMKLNATSEMLPISWPGFAALHPFAPLEQARGYQELFASLESWLCAITGFCACSLQPNAGSQGEYTGLLVIRAYHRARGQEQRRICLIPSSAHGTNPASARMAGMEVIVVACNDQGDIDMADLRAKTEAHADDLAAIMLTYPSTHGVFEGTIKEICSLVHEHGGQVYLDGANMNALVGLCKLAELGADVCHLNLHKTFCIPHGGGGPGMGPICVAEQLQGYLPGHGFLSNNAPPSSASAIGAIGAVSSAPWGSPSILPISWAYIAMMGASGLTLASKVAILNANYIALRLDEHFPVLYKGQNGLVAHECILDVRPLKASAGIEVNDIAKRLIDYGFHAPTMSWPVAGTLMVEPTESEGQVELDRFCAAMIAIRQEIREIEEGRMDPQDNVLKNAPHTARSLCVEEWTHPYSREQAVYPAQSTLQHKYWPPVGRVDDLYGDRNLVCRTT